MNEIPTPSVPRWTIRDSAELYLIDRWGSGYFDVDKYGAVTMHPIRSKGASIPIVDVVFEAQSQGLVAPLLIRFQDNLKDRVTALNEAFRHVISEYGYESTYQGVYPIKVNQLREVVEEIVTAGECYHAGLEVGSKAELFAALAISANPQSLLVCNGYKDQNYIRTALAGLKLGKNVILVAEKLSEIELTAKLSKRIGVVPRIGLRLRLSTEGSGNWARSGGEHAKFGLSTSEILDALRILREAGLESSLCLLHFHIGSQIPDILTIKSAVREGTRIYAKLRKMGAGLKYLDVGGGLAVDYDGSRSFSHSSRNYSEEEYARDVVYNIMDVCKDESVPHPCIISESGRSTVAYHSILVINAFGSISKNRRTASLELPDTEHKLVRDLLEAEERLRAENLLETWHDLVQTKRESQKMFDVGVLDLETKASIEILFWRITQKINEQALRQDEGEVPDELLALSSQLSDQLICNFSVFQSLLDHWALGQLFPVMPLHRLNERPEGESKLVDITCDSDGKVTKFIDLTDARVTLPTHLDVKDPYYLGIFLGGAYQDIMGDIHNLFGRVNEVHVFLDDDEPGGFYIEERIPGNTIAEVLAMTQYDAKDLIKRIKSHVAEAIRNNRLRPNQGMQLVEEYRKGLEDQTYLAS